MSGAAGAGAGFGGDFDLFAFLNEEGDTDLESGFEGGGFGDAAAGGIAADAGFGVGDGEVDEGGELEADGVAVVFAEFDEGAVDQKVEGVGDDVFGEGEGFEGFLVEEVRAARIAIQVGRGDEGEVGLLKLFAGFEGALEDGVGEEVPDLEADEGLSSAGGGSVDFGFEAGEGDVVELEEGSFLDVDCVDQGCHRFKYRKIRAETQRKARRENRRNGVISFPE
jgi:hypothetical protein